MLTTTSTIRYLCWNSSVMVVELSSISNPITVIGISVSTARTVVVLRHRADPDCGTVRKPVVY